MNRQPATHVLSAGLTKDLLHANITFDWDVLENLCTSFKHCRLPLDWTAANLGVITKLAQPLLLSNGKSSVFLQMGK